MQSNWYRTDDGFAMLPISLSAEFVVGAIEFVGCMGGCSELNGAKRLTNLQVARNIAIAVTAGKLIRVRLDFWMVRSPAPAWFPLVTMVSVPGSRVAAVVMHRLGAGLQQMVSTDG